MQDGGTFHTTYNTIVITMVVIAYVNRSIPYYAFMAAINFYDVIRRKRKEDIAQHVILD